MTITLRIPKWCFAPLIMLALLVGAQADTVRTVVALQNLLRDGQTAGSITPVVIRDMLVSTALQNGNFSDLPTSLSGLTVGRVWVNGNTLQIVQ